MYTAWKELLTKTVGNASQDRVPRLGTALAFYATFSVVPLLILSGAVASLFFGEEAVRGHLKHELVDFLGNDAAEGIQSMLAASEKSRRAGVIPSLVGGVALVFGAAGVFMELKNSMNTVWNVEVRPELGIWGAIKDSAASFVVVVMVAVLLLLSMILSAFLSAIGHQMAISTSAHLTDFLVSATVTTLLFAYVFKFLPDVVVLWKDVWIGAIVTAILFAIGKQLVSLYLANIQLASAYGVVSSILVFMLWTYYSSQIFLLGAEFTQVYSQTHGRSGTPRFNAHTATGKWMEVAEAKQAGVIPQPHSVPT